MTAIGMDMIPRTISRAQSFDSLSSQANIAGYRAVIEAGVCLPHALIMRRFIIAAIWCTYTAYADLQNSALTPSVT